MQDELISIVLRLLGLFGLALLNGCFVAAEFALVSVRRTRIEQLASNGSARARGIVQALDRLDMYIAATQLGITIASLSLGAIGDSAIAPIFEPLFGRFLPGSGAWLTSHVAAFVVSFALTTMVAIVFGELVPKNLALQHSEQVALWLTPPLNFFLRIFQPVVLLLRWLANLVLRSIGLQPTQAHSAVHSVEELELLVHSTTAAGLLEAQQERMVAGIFDFGERQASRVMTPRTELQAVPVTIGLRDLAHQIVEGQHSRLVVYDADLDHILGVVHARDVLRILARQDDPPQDPASFNVRDILRRVPFFPETLELDELMAELRRRGAQVAVIIDEFGGTAGIVTLEDLLEEIVGEVKDEFDPSQETVLELPDGGFLVDGLLAVEEVDERFDLGIKEPFYDTLGGYIFGQLGRAAALGDEVVAPSGRRLRVAELDGLRVARVEILPPDDHNPELGAVVGDARRGE